MSSIDIQLTDITTLDVDAIVNAANNGLKAGKGLCDAIFDAAGRDELQAACKKIGHCDTGSAVITPGFNLDAKFIIHAVGPVWHGGNRGEPQQLYDAYKSSLSLANSNGCQSVGLPLLSTGNRRYPVEKAWMQAIRACYDFFADQPTARLRIIFAVRSERALALGEKILKKESEERSLAPGFVSQRKDYAQFVTDTVCRLGERPFEQLRDVLISDYLTFSVIQPTDVTPSILAEKICDYFETLEIKTRKPFSAHVNAYMDALDAIVAPRVAGPPDKKKNAAESTAAPRARRYYEKARSLREPTPHGIRQVLDYSRIMLCLYAAIVNEGFSTITNLDFSSHCLEPQKLLREIRFEEIPAFLLQPKRPRFNTRELYSPDTCTMILAAIALYTIVSERAAEEDAHE